LRQRPLRLFFEPLFERCDREQHDAASFHVRDFISLAQAPESSLRNAQCLSSLAQSQGEFFDGHFPLPFVTIHDCDNGGVCQSRLRRIRLKPIVSVTFRGRGEMGGTLAMGFL